MLLKTNETSSFLIFSRNIRIEIARKKCRFYTTEMLKIILTYLCMFANSNGYFVNLLRGESRQKKFVDDKLSERIATPKF